MTQLLFFAFLSFGFADEARPEGWSDSGLPPAGRNGLVLWLDAATIEAAAKSEGKPAPTPGAPLDQWSDGSGAGRHFIAPKSSNRPRYIKQQERPYVEFDGEDDYFTYFGKPIKARESTIFVVAAPYANNGAFRGLVAAAPPALNDYTHGFNIDLGSNFSARWDMLNFEGAGAGGQRNLLQESAPFGALRRLAVVVGKEVRLFVNGKPEGRRPRETSLLSLERWTVGARHFSNESRPPYAQGFLEGAIAEVLVYDRLLTDSERRAVEEYLAKKHPPDVRLASGRKPARGIRFAPLENPPAVQMLAPGFEAVALPVKLPNINYLRYRRDGKLFAGGYNGKIYLLADTDGDGVEDSSKLYWESPTLKVAMGMAVAPPGHPKGDGLYVLSVGRLVFLPDRNGDDKADEEIVVAEGWAPARVATQGVSDGLGLAIAPDGSFYFGLGTSDFTDAYLLRGGAKAAYDPKGERGTMQKVSADWSRREQICSGLRFTVGVAVDAAGHVFCTDQEGATWLSNGNPFDELLHIQRGRHYGFPPRHPRHNPDVIDEPSLFDYSPQHQSTCGMNFNRDDAFGKRIGPDFWANDALVVGQSRGKLFRTKIVAGHADFVAANSLLGCVQTLPVDVATTPDGGLVVCGHSGGPDWGTGPAGIGVIYK
ncbi:MAG TPA: hypothetical protein VNC50_16095, partial [Planctomycetia bacterium]|nr:hypothetical protein [Planctomycetia bacterium]